MVVFYQIVWSRELWSLIKDEETDVGDVGDVGDVLDWLEILGSPRVGE